jgi:hypothetical protein
MTVWSVVAVAYYVFERQGNGEREMSNILSGILRIVIQISSGLFPSSMCLNFAISERFNEVYRTSVGLSIAPIVIID